MKYILDVLNKIKWDARETLEEYIVVYLDRIDKNKKEIKFKEIKNFNNLTLELEDREIPLHRIREIKKGNKIIWKR